MMIDDHLPRCCCSLIVSVIPLVVLGLTLKACQALRIMSA